MPVDATINELLEQLTFGVEIETHCPNRIHDEREVAEGGGGVPAALDAPSDLPPVTARRVPGLAVGPRHAGIHVPDHFIPASSDGKRWKAERDGSIVTPNYRRSGIEWVSPVLKGRDGLKYLIASVKHLKDTCGARVNSSCGFHVHVGFPTNDLRALQRLVHLVAGFENGLFAATGTKSRERSRWCRPIKNDYRGINYRSLNGRQPRGAVADRYHSLNLENMISGRQSTVEFRIFAGTLNPYKIAAYVQLCLGLVELALRTKIPSKWNTKEAGEQYGKELGQGSREVNRLMVKLGWTSGKNTSPAGRVGFLGGANTGLPTMASCVKMLREMARKYDEQA